MNENLRELWRLPAPYSKIGCALIYNGRLVVTGSNVFQGKNVSGIFVDGDLVRSDPVETFDAAAVYLGKVYFVAEHRKHMLTYHPVNGFKEGVKMGMDSPAGYQGRWSIATPFVWHNTLCFTTNDDYRADKTFGDFPFIRSCMDGRVLARLGRKCLPIDSLMVEGIPFFPCGFGFDGILGLNGMAFAGDFQRIASCYGRYFAGGGVRYGKTGSNADRNGWVYVYDNGKFKKLFNTEGCGVQSFLATPKGLYVSGSNPDTLWHIRSDLTRNLVAAFPVEPRPDIRGGGTAIAFNAATNTIYFIRCDKDRGYVYEVLN